MAAGAIVAGVAIAAGTAISIYGKQKEGKAQEEAIRAGAEAKRQQAFEILGRSETNIVRLREEAEIFKARQTGQVVRGGAAIRGNTLIQLEQTNRDVLNSIADQRREAAFKADQLRRGADIDFQLAGDLRSSRRLSLIGGIIGGAGKAASAGFRR